MLFATTRIDEFSVDCFGWYSRELHVSIETALTIAEDQASGEENTNTHLIHTVDNRDTLQTHTLQITRVCKALLSVDCSKQASKQASKHAC